MYANSDFEFSQVVGPRGLLNLGNTCYINSVLQGLQGHPKFKDFFSNTVFTGVMSKALAVLIANMNVNGAEPYDSSAFLDALECCCESYKKHTQMDAEEFFAFLLNTLHDELKTKVGGSPVHSQEDMSDLPAVVVNRWFSREFSPPIGLLFHVQTVTLLFCPTCNFQHGQYADMTNHLSLPVKCSIEESFKSFSMESVLEDGRCSSCGALGLKHRLLLGRLPPLLVDLTPASNECMNNAQCHNSKDESFPVTDERDTDNSYQSEDIFEDVDDFNIATNIQNLTQPHSPLQCNHIKFDLDIMDPVLSEEEVPGAKLNMESLENCRKSALERWLLCRRINKSRNKQELISRIMNHQKTDKSKLIFPGIDGGKWYELKRKKLMEQVDTLSRRLPMMPLGLSVFKSFPSAHIPNGFSFDKATEYLQQIPLTRFSYEHGVQSVECEPDEECLLDFSQPSDGVRKNLSVNGTMQRANQFVNSGRVLSVMDCERGDHYFIKADVHASYRTLLKIPS
ncbi:Putative ubiquitin carboxyl-terminal hydrolase 50 [Frankliniella fusca]|uniref:ubiquitinyl hydrolase 1 n=1 Tax=Frankliniella fusca TaxID=407009 RepID=A0AAE1HX55_9NEOP|nr:Putative ubiquitin carboxyl-terminal hydrolase 50 [Frankliniella fusca]